MSGKDSREIRGRHDLHALGERIRRSRLNAGFRTNVDLAKEVNVSEASMSAYIRGLQRPSPEILERIAAAVKVSADWLIDGDEPDVEEGGLGDPFPKEALSAKVNFWALYISIRMCQEWFQKLGVPPSLKEVIEWIGPHYTRARELPDLRIEFKPPEES